MRRVPCLAVVTFLLLRSWSPAAAQEQPVRTIPLNGYKQVLDGQWQGIRFASDGNVYFGSSTHSANHGAAFFKFDPRTSQLTLLAEDLSPICGDDPTVSPQGKLHSDIVEANGWLYMSTHFSSERPGAYDLWSGSCVLGYELATGQFRNYGVVHPKYTSYSGVGVDPTRNYLYVFLTGEYPHEVSYLYRVNTVTGEKTNLGQVGRSFDSTFWMFVDRRGDVWFSVASQNGALFRVRGETGVIEMFPDALPPMYRWDVEQPIPDGGQYRRQIMWMQPLDGDRALFTLGWEGGMLYLFDSSKPIGSGQEFRAIRHIGYSDLGLAVGDDRVFYYQRANRGFGQQEHQDFHLLSVSLNADAGYPITDHGLLRDQDGRLVWRVPGMMTDGHNRVFMIGDWWTIPGDVPTLRYRYNGGDSYQVLPRGEFFAVADVEIDDTAPDLALLTVAPTFLTGGLSSADSHVGLTAPAPPDGIEVTLSSSEPSVATVPPSIVVPAGATTAPFTFVTAGVAAARAVTITASRGLVSRTASVTITPASLVLLAVQPAADAGTPALANRVALNGAAPPGGAVVTLSSSSPAASVPASVVVPAGSTTSHDFTIETLPVSAATVVTITASYHGTSRTGTLTIQPVTLVSATILPSAVDAGTPADANRVTLNRPAPPGGALVALSSSHPTVATTPGFVVVPPGSTTSPVFTIVTKPVGVSTTVTIGANYGGINRTGSLTVNAVTPYAVTLSTSSVNAGTPIGLNRVSLNRPAPPGDAVIALSSSHPAILSVPASIVVPAASTTSPYFAITTTAVTVATLVSISASYAGVTRSAAVTVYPVTLASVSLSPLAVNAGSPATANRVTLSRGAPPAGAVVGLASSHPSLASVPPAVTVPAAALTSALFSIDTSPVATPTTVTITASYEGVTRTAALTIYPVTLGSLTLGSSGVDAGSAVTTNRAGLNRPAPPGGAVVALSSSHPTIAAVPASTLVPSGGTQSPNFTIITSPVASNTVVTITASFGGVTRTATITVYAVTLASVTVSPSAVNAGTPATANRLALTRSAPPGGAVVTLASSHPAIAAVPASVIVPAGGTASSLFPITTGTVATTTTVTISASFGGVTRTGLLIVYPVAVQSLTLYPATLKGGVSSAYNRVNLNRVAPPGGAMVVLSTSHPALLSLPAMVVVPGGSTTSAAFTIPTTAVSVTTPVTISASFGGFTQVATLTLTP